MFPTKCKIFTVPPDYHGFCDVGKAQEAHNQKMKMLEEEINSFIRNLKVISIAQMQGSVILFYQEIA